MYSAKTNMFSIVKNQYMYKFKAYTGFFWALIVAQLIAGLFSLAGVESMSSGSSIADVNVMFYSGDVVLGFTFVWIFVIAITMTTKIYRNMDFTFVTNRISSNLSNLGFILVSCILGSLTASLYSVLLRVILYFSTDRMEIINEGIKLQFHNLLLGMVVAVLYMILLGGFGYFAGILVQVNKLFAVIIPAVIFGSIVIEESAKRNLIIGKFVKFFIEETSPVLFTVKVILASGGLFIISFILSNRMEVKR